MSRQENDREDLLREASALVERAEFDLDSSPEPVVVGFRRNGGASFFFGADPVYQFNSDSQLRRCYYGGRLVKSEDGQLFWLDRERDEGQSILRRSKLSSEETASLLQSVGQELGELQERLGAGRYTLVGQHPSSVDIAQRICDWLQSLPRPIAIAASPHAGSLE